MRIFRYCALLTRAILISLVLIGLIEGTFVQHTQAQIAPTSSATISGSVSDSEGKPIANARVVLSGPRNSSTQTDAHGLFVFVGVPFGTYAITAEAAGSGIVTRAGLALQGDINVAIEYEPASLNKLKVIANVASSANALFNVTPASITQVSPVASAFQGQTSWRKIIEQIPGVAQAGLGSGGDISSALADGPMQPVQISINGALPYETAVLVDDMPLIGGEYFNTAGTGTDLGVYPLNAFGAADVVRGPGAAAPSIVNSIGGSFVLHAPGTVSADHYLLSLSTDPYGGIIANAQAAVRWKKLSAVVTYGVNDSPGPRNQAVIPQDTFTPLTVNGLAYYSSIPSLFLVNTKFANCAYYGYGGGLLVGPAQVSTAWSQHSGSIALNYDFSTAIHAQVFYAGQISLQNQLLADDETFEFTPPAGYTGSIPAGLQMLPLMGSDLSTTPTLQQASSMLEEKVTAQLGRGILKLAALQNRTFTPLASITPGSERLQLFGGGCLAASPGGTGGCPAGYTPAVFNGSYNNLTFCTYAAIIDKSNNNRDLLFEYLTPINDNIHAGASLVTSYYDTLESVSGYIGPPVNISFASNIPSDVSESTDELHVFVGGSPSRTTSLDLSGYFVNLRYHVANPLGYDSTTGTSSSGWLNPTFTYAAPRLGFVWRPTASVAVRVAAGGGFSEAPLSYLTGSSGTPTLNPGGYYSVSLTNVNMQPEKSFGFDIGTDIRMPHATVVSLDLYQTNLQGQFYTSSAPDGTYLGLPLYATQYGNLGESRYEGILLDVRHDAPHGIYWSLSGGLTRGYVVNVPAGFYNQLGVTCDFATNVGCQNQSVVPGVNFNGTFTGVSVPYSQALGIIGYRWSTQKYVDLMGTYFGNNNTYFRPAFAELDGHVSYPISRNASLLVTFQNITGIYDSSIGAYTAENFMGVPTVAGLPYAEWGQQYGPRTILLTTQVSF